jgi:hypothetical protein
MSMLCFSLSCFSSDVILSRLSSKQAADPSSYFYVELFNIFLIVVDIVLLQEMSCSDGICHLANSMLDVVLQLFRS